MGSEQEENRPITPRHTAIIKEAMVEATIRGVMEAAYSEQRPKHNKNPSLGFKEVRFSNSVVLEQEDALSFGDGEEITLMNWANAIVRQKQTSLNPPNNRITHLELELHPQGDFKKPRKRSPGCPKTALSTVKSFHSTISSPKTSSKNRTTF